MERKSVLILIAVILTIGVGVGGYFGWKKIRAWQGQSALKAIDKAADTLKEGATRGVLPPMDLKSNPMEEAPDVNPISKTNPFSEVKTNPFK